MEVSDIVLVLAMAAVFAALVLFDWPAWGRPKIRSAGRRQRSLPPSPSHQDKPAHIGNPG